MLFHIVLEDFHWVPLYLSGRLRQTSPSASALTDRFILGRFSETGFPGVVPDLKFGYTPEAQASGFFPPQCRSWCELVSGGSFGKYFWGVLRSLILLMTATNEELLFATDHPLIRYPETCLVGTQPSVSVFLHIYYFLIDFIFLYFLHFIYYLLKYSLQFPPYFLSLYWNFLHSH